MHNYKENETDENHHNINRRLPQKEDIKNQRQMINLMNLWSVLHSYINTDILIEWK